VRVGSRSESPRAPHVPPARYAFSVRLPLAVVLALVPAAALAWSEDGHRLVAAVADERMSPAARRLVRDIAGGPLAAGDVATWADAQKDERTRPWHYVNIPPGSTYDPARDCPRGACVVAAIARAEAALRDGGSDLARADALRWLVHLVADVHQPLHAGDAADRGGNKLELRLHAGRGQPWNLHRVWDDLVVRPVAHGRSPAGHDSERVVNAAHALLAAAPATAVDAWAADASPASWANASSRTALALRREVDGWARDGRFPVLPPRYVEAQRPRVEAALVAAGVRLAALLDRVAADASRSP
jgi:nuclease S1